MRWAVWMLVAGAIVGCGDGADPSDPIRGPEGGVLRFDGAMIDFDGGLPDAPSSDAPRSDVPLDGGRADVPGPRRCVGIPRSCLSYESPFECDSHEGCRSDGTCSGFATSCYSRFSSFSCASQDGCVWDSSRDQCNGSARSCSGYFGESSCLGQDGCFWEDRCAGSALPCGAYTEATCALQEGCYLE